MVIDKILREIINRHGIPFNIKRNGDDVHNFKAVLQPLRYKNKIYLEGVPTELGYDNLKKYLMITKADVNLAELDNINISLYSRGTHYSVDHTEKVYCNGVAFYTWSIVSKEE